MCPPVAVTCACLRCLYCVCLIKPNQTNKKQKNTNLPTIIHIHENHTTTNQKNSHIKLNSHLPHPNPPPTPDHFIYIHAHYTNQNDYLFEKKIHIKIATKWHLRPNATIKLQTVKYDRKQNRNPPYEIDIKTHAKKNYQKKIASSGIRLHLGKSKARRWNNKKKITNRKK